jgi:hypothetical protein
VKASEGQTRVGIVPGSVTHALAAAAESELDSSWHDIKAQFATEVIKALDRGYFLTVRSAQSRTAKRCTRIGKAEKASAPQTIC